MWLSGKQKIYDYLVNTKYMIIRQRQNIWLSGKHKIYDYQVNTIYMIIG